MGDRPGIPAGQSPYPATALELVQRFATSMERAALLMGFFELRGALRAAGIVNGFQWIDGSFVEHAEATKGRPPGDIDVVTLFHRPADRLGGQRWDEFVDAHIDTLFDPEFCKAVYHCDAYVIDLYADPETSASQAAYWFGLFSHQRDTFRWKGIVQVRLEQDDSAAVVELDRRVRAWQIN